MLVCSSNFLGHLLVVAQPIKLCLLKYKMRIQLIESAPCEDHWPVLEKEILRGIDLVKLVEVIF